MSRLRFKLAKPLAKPYSLAYEKLFLFSMLLNIEKSRVQDYEHS